MTSFNPRPCARGDRLTTIPLIQLPNVSIHAPVRGATIDYSTSGTSTTFQSTPLCEGRRARSCLAVCGHVSIHAPVRGATRKSTIELPRLSSFNPRPCARGDAARTPPFAPGFVSIHAPVRGATEELQAIKARRKSFNPRPCARGDQIGLSRCRLRECFNPRPCARGDYYTVEGFERR